MKDRLLYDHDAFGNSIAGISCGRMGLERNVLKKHAASTVASFLSRHCRFHLQSSHWKVVLWTTSLSLSSRSSSPKSSNTEQRELIFRGYSYFRTIISSKPIFTCFALRPQASVHSVNEFCFVFQNILLLPKSAVTSNS